MIKMIIGWWTVYRIIQVSETMEIWDPQFIIGTFIGKTPPPQQLQRIRSQYRRVPQPTAQAAIKAHGLIVQIGTWLKRYHHISYKDHILKHLEELVHDCLRAETCTQPAEAHLQCFCATDFHTSCLQCQMYLVKYVCACASKCIGIQRIGRVDVINTLSTQKYANNPEWPDFVDMTNRRNQIFQRVHTSVSSSSTDVQRTPTPSVASTGCKRKREPSSANEASDAQKKARVVVTN